MSFPEGFPGHGEVQKQFSNFIVEKPQAIFIESPHILTVDDLINPDKSLAQFYQKKIELTIEGLGLLPENGKLPIASSWQPHDRSSGQYYVEYEIVKPNSQVKGKNDRYHIYSYVLPSGLPTSIHSHNAFEFYILHAGDFTLTLDGQEGELKRFAVVAPGVEHTGRAGVQPALVTAITYNPLDIPRSELHKYQWSKERDWTDEMSDRFHEILDELEMVA
jgi:hypothetical protein